MVDQLASTREMHGEWMYEAQRTGVVFPIFHHRVDDSLDEAL